MLTKFAALDNKIKDLKTTIHDLTAKNNVLMEINEDLQNENAILREKVDSVNVKFEILKQKSYEYDVELCGVPMEENEDLSIIGDNLLDNLHIPKAVKIKEIYRGKRIVNTSGLPPVIILRFNKRDEKSLVLDSKKGKKLDSTLVLPNAEKRPIYINERMSKHNKYLFKKARELIKNGSIKFAWFKNGKVLIRKTDKSKVIIYNDKYKQ